MTPAPFLHHILRTIAASLTCCRYCGVVYLDNWVGMLHCPRSPVAIDFHGRLTKRHSAIAGWSLTAYLKALHGAGMNWDAIYWHVWASCQVFRVHDFMFSILETDRWVYAPSPSSSSPSPSSSSSPSPYTNSTLHCHLHSLAIDSRSSLMDCWFLLPISINPTRE